jgi:hypothetical protein
MVSFSAEEAMKKKVAPSAIRTALIAAGVRNLKEFGYPSVNPSNILDDIIYSRFFESMLDDNKGRSKEVDAEIESLLAEIKQAKEKDVK